MYKIEPLFLRRLKIIKLTSGIKYRKRRLGISRGRDLVPMARTNARAMLDELGMLVYLPSCEHHKSIISIASTRRSALVIQFTYTAVYGAMSYVRTQALSQGAYQVSTVT